MGGTMRRSRGGSDWMTRRLASGGSAGCSFERYPWMISAWRSGWPMPPREGAPAKFTPEQVCQIIALACEKPADSDRPISHWSHRELADEIVRRGIVESISPRHAGRLLKRRRSQTTTDSVL